MEFTTLVISPVRVSMLRAITETLQVLRCFGFLWILEDLTGAFLRCPFPSRCPRKEWTKTHELVGVPDGCLNSYAPLGERGQ